MTGVDAPPKSSGAAKFRELGFTVTQAGSADEALRLLNAGTRFDLLVTDHLMPGMSGTELAHEIRARRSDTAVLIISGYAEAVGISPDLPRLTKPFRGADLATKLRELTAQLPSGADQPR